MVLNLIFRFWWLIAVFLPKFDVIGLEIMVAIGMLVEGIRRTIWSIIRIENEFFNNFEEYRDIIAIPPIKEEENEDIE